MKWNWTSQLGRRTGRAGRSRTGFTLIELLVVIAIIATLAGLVASLAAGAGKKKVRARATALIEELTTAIEGYKDKMGFLPPDNPVELRPGEFYYGRSPLYYFLKGTQRRSDSSGQPIEFKTVDGKRLTPAEIHAAFGLDGFLNSVAEGEKPKDFYPSLKQSSVAEENGVRFIVIPYKGPRGDFNPVNYDASSSNRHNPESYDLWIEAMIGREKVIIGNWRE